MAKTQEGITIHQSKLLIVEGLDDERFFGALTSHMNIADIQVIQLGGKARGKLKSKLQAIKNAFGFENVTNIGIVQDADGNPKGAFDSGCSALQSAGLPVPAKPLIRSAKTPHIVIIAMPPTSMGTNRMLEDLCLEAVKDDPATACMLDYFGCLQERNITHRDTVIAKAHLHAFLASRGEPDLRLGEAAQKGYWPWKHPAFDMVKAFIQQLADS
jgi:hypothetical protein